MFTWANRPSLRKERSRLGPPFLLLDPLVDGGAGLLCQAIAHEVIVDPHETADDPAFLMPLPHHRLHLARRVVLVPHPGEKRHFAKIAARTWFVSVFARICF